MATPDQGRKRTWRFRLNDTTALEVSAKAPATEKQVRRRGRWSLVLGTLIAALMLVAAALADNTIADGDGVTPVANNDMAFGNVSCGVATTKTALIAISRNGNYATSNVFQKGSTVTVAVQSVSGAGLSALMGATTTINIPANWDTVANTTLTSTVSSTVTVNSSSPGAGSGSVVFEATGTKSDGTTPFSREDTMNVSWTVLNDCAPANNAPTVTVTGVTNEGSYEIGSVPASGCSVVDTEDGNSTPAATLSAITGANATYGIGSQTASCSYTDGGGITRNASATYSIVDTGNPTITFVSRTPANANGWNNSDVTVTWSCSDSGSGVLSATETKTVSTQGSNQSATGTCTDHAGNTATDTQTGINIDKTAPSVAYTSASPSPNGAGWNKTDVVATFTATDTLSGFAGASTTKTGTSTTSSEGSAVTVGSPAFTDLAGNTAPAGTATSDAFMIDKTNPSVSVTGVSNGATYTLGSVPAAGCSTSDSLSGVKTNASLLVSGGTVNGVGSFTATCNGANDNADNSQATPVSASYSVIYDPAGISGILQPINPDNTSLFSRGKAVPVKFRLAGDEPSGFDYSGWALQRIKVACNNFDLEDAAIEAVAENPSNAFRYDAGADQYINNASFKDQAAGTCWKVRVTLDSGQTMESAIFKLQK